MNRFVLSALLLAISATLCHGHDRGVLERDTVIVKTAPADSCANRIHLRVGLPSSGDFEWGLNLTGHDGSARRIVISGNADDLRDGDYPAPLYFTDSVADVTRRKVSQAATAEDYSLRLTGRYGEFGSKLSEYDFDIGDTDVTGVTAVISRGMALRRFDVTFKRANRPERCTRFENVESLKAYLSASKDPRECFWTYLDRNLDFKNCTLGGRYVLASVSDGEGGYMLLYVDGAERGTDKWEPLMIKGRLDPTVFDGHYNLTWTDAFGRTEPDAESSATFDPGNNLLTLDFPLYGPSQLRFARRK